MKTIGLIGGMSYESTVDYYKMINKTVNETLGGHHSAKCILYSVDFDEIERLQRNGGWTQCATILNHAAHSLQRAGADFIVICTNTMHKVASEVQVGLSIPLLHIAEVTARELIGKGIRRVALLGTRYTMEQDFYKAKLRERGVEVLIPLEEERERVNEIIFDELCAGVQKEDSRQAYLEIVERLAGEGAQGVVLGCTEIGMLIKQEDTAVRLFDTTVLHAKAAAQLAMAE